MTEIFIPSIGICGREGAGKTTISNHLCNHGECKQFLYIRIQTPLYYVLETIFGWNYQDLHKNAKNNFSEMPRDVIWNLTVLEAIEKIMTLFKKHIGENWEFLEDPLVPYDVIIPDQKYMEYAFADPLKKIASVMFEFPSIPQMDLHEILRGDIEETRNIREKIITTSYDRCGVKTGRGCLEFLGTDILRDNFDNEIWIKIFHRETLKYRQRGITMVIPDTRFENEKNAIENDNGVLLVVYRDEKDLLLTEEDKKKHPAKWKFLEFLPNIKNLKKIHNNGSIEDLHQKLAKIISNN